MKRLVAIPPKPDAWPCCWNTDPGTVNQDCDCGQKVGPKGWCRIHRAPFHGECKQCLQAQIRDLLLELAQGGHQDPSEDE